MSKQGYENLCECVEKIDKNAAEYMRGDARKLLSFKETGSILLCFEWEDTPQGLDYWWNIDDMLNNCTLLSLEIKRQKTRLRMSQAELSKAIGKSKNYLSEMVNRGCSKEKEREIIALLNDLKSDDEIIANLSEQLGNANDERVVLRSEISDLNYYLDVKDKKIKELKHKNYDVCQKLYESQEKNRNLISKASRAEIMMNIYFIVAMILGVLLGVFWS